MLITPKNRKEFEKHIDILAESIIQKTFKIPPDLRIIQSMLNAKSLPNNRTNFLTIDEQTRLLANTVTSLKSKVIENEINDEKP